MKNLKQFHPCCAKLSNREQQILGLIADEWTTFEISKMLHVSPETVKSHRKSLLRKLKARNVAGLIKRGYEIGVLAVGG